MLYLLSGAVASGKTTIGRAVCDRLEGVEYLEEGTRIASDGDGRLRNLEFFIEDALQMEAEGIDAVFGSQAPLGELLASPRAIELEGIAACLLDAHDAVRIERWRQRTIQRGHQADEPPGMDHFCWAAFHRLHAHDPRYEQRVLLTRDHPASEWDRWKDWEPGDPRWNVLTNDSSAQVVDETVEVVAEWIASVRVGGAPLQRQQRWWE